MRAGSCQKAHIHRGRKEVPQHTGSRRHPFPEDRETTGYERKRRHPFTRDREMLHDKGERKRGHYVGVGFEATKRVTNEKAASRNIELQPL